MMFQPEVGSFLIVGLPGETVRVPVHQVVDRDTVFISLDVQPVGKQHFYRRGDIVAVQRNHGALGETWDAVDERLMAAREVARNRKKTHAAKPRK